MIASPLPKHLPAPDAPPALDLDDIGAVVVSEPTHQPSDECVALPITVHSPASSVSVVPSTAAPATAVDKPTEDASTKPVTQDTSTNELDSAFGMVQEAVPAPVVVSTTQ